jgi:hypothetical protein
MVQLPQNRHAMTDKSKQKNEGVLMDSFAFAFWVVMWPISVSLCRFLNNLGPDKDEKPTMMKVHIFNFAVWVIVSAVLHPW